MRAIIEDVRTVEVDGTTQLRAGIMKLVVGAPHKLSITEKLLIVNEEFEGNFINLEEVCQKSNVPFSISEP